MDICLGVVAHAGVQAQLPGQQDLCLGLEAAALPADDHGAVLLDDDVVRRQPRLRVRGEHQAAAVVDDNLDAEDNDRVGKDCKLHFTFRSLGDTTSKRIPFLISSESPSSGRRPLSQVSWSDHLSKDPSSQGQGPATAQEKLSDTSSNLASPAIIGS